jgi:hypothetical protein
MDLVGKYIATWMTPHIVFEGIFGFTENYEPGADRTILIAGQVVGETPGVGLWVKIEVLLDENDKDISPSISKKQPTRLIRWQLIENVEIFLEKPSRSDVGFRPR